MKWTQAVGFLTLGVLAWIATGEELDERLRYPSTSDQLFPSNAEGSYDDTDWGAVIDYLLHLTNNRTLYKGRDEVLIPDIDKPFRRKVGLVTLKGVFEARGGRVSGLSRVRRTGGVTAVRHGTAITLTTSLGLEDPRLKFDYYRVDLKPGPSMSGNIEGEVRHNSVQLTATLNLDETSCRATLNDVKVLELKGLKIKVHRLGPPLDYLLSNITTWLTHIFERDVKKLLEKTLKTELTKGLERSRCEKYATHFIFIDPK